MTKNKDQASQVEGLARAAGREEPRRPAKGLKVRTGVKSGIHENQHCQSRRAAPGVKVRTGVKSGLRENQHCQSRR